VSYLRFTPFEYQAICRLCRPLDLDDDFLPDFKGFLVASLLGDLPALAKRIALFRRNQLRVLFHHVRGPKAQAADALTSEELRALSQACRSLIGVPRFLHTCKDSLIHHFEETRPALARKLVRMSADQFQELFWRMKVRRRKE
jgi:hypothetical protein